MPDQPKKVPNEIKISLPGNMPEFYADFASIWHNQDTFVLDFIAMQHPPQPVKGEDGIVQKAVMNAQGKVRVRIPASQVWEVMKGLEKQLTHFENQKKAAGQQPPAPPDSGS